MASIQIRERINRAVEKTKDRLTVPSSWTLPKQDSSIAPDHVW